MLCFLLISAQKVEGTSVKYKPCSGFAISKPLSEMPVVNGSDKNGNERPEINIHNKSLQVNKTAQPLIDPVLQAGMGNKTAAPPIANFDGLPGTSSA